MSRLSARLAYFLFKNDIKKNVLAVELEVKPQTISNWLHKNRKPQILVARKLVDYTNGYISLKDCGHE